MLTLESTRDPMQMNTVYILTVPDKDRVRVKFDALDAALMDRPDGSVADELLRLQVLAFRIEQQAGVNRGNT